MVEKTERITSRENSRLIAARKVRDGKDPARIFIEGRRLVEEALKSQIDLDECFVSENFRSDGLIEQVGGQTHSIIELSEKLFSTIADTDSPQGIVLIAKRPVSDRSTIESNVSSASISLTVFLKEINNPSNLGAILRTAEAAGVAGVIISTNSADAFAAKAIRASMGAAFRIPVWYNAEFYEVLNWAAANNLTVTACDVSAALSYTDIDWKLSRLLVFGSEAHGLDSDDLGKIQEKINIPMANQVESLNLSVSAGIILFEAKRQRA